MFDGQMGEVCLRAGFCRQRPAASSAITIEYMEKKRENLSTNKTHVADNQHVVHAKSKGRGKAQVAMELLGNLSLSRWHQCLLSTTALP